MTRAEEIAYERGQREGARAMAFAFYQILAGPYDRVNGNDHFIMGQESAAGMCLAYALMDDPVQWIADNQAEIQAHDIKMAHEAKAKEPKAKP